MRSLFSNIRSRGDAERGGPETESLLRGGSSSSGDTQNEPHAFERLRDRWESSGDQHPADQSSAITRPSDSAAERSLSAAFSGVGLRVTRETRAANPSDVPGTGPEMVSGNLPLNTILNARIIAPNLLNPTPAELAHGVRVELVIDGVSSASPPENVPLATISRDSVRSTPLKSVPVLRFSVSKDIPVLPRDVHGKLLFARSTSDKAIKDAMFGRGPPNQHHISRAIWQSLACFDAEIETPAVLPLEYFRAEAGQKEHTNAAVAFLLEASSKADSDGFAYGYLNGPENFPELLLANSIAKSRPFVCDADVVSVIESMARSSAWAEPKSPIPLQELVFKSSWLVARYLLTFEPDEKELGRKSQALLKKMADYAQPISGGTPEYFWHGRLRGLIFGTFSSGLYRTIATIAKQDQARAKVVTTALDSVISAVSAAIGPYGAIIELVKPWILLASDHYMEKHVRDYGSLAKKSEARLLEAMQRAKALSIEHAQDPASHEPPLKYDVASAMDWFMIAMKYGGY